LVDGNMVPSEYSVCRPRVLPSRWCGGDVTGSARPTLMYG